MTSSSDIRQTFFQECDELLEALNDGLDEIARTPDGSRVDHETINAVFRAVHSIKGGAGAFALKSLVQFAHQFETTLDEMRSDRLAPTGEVMKVCLRSADHLATLVACARDGVEDTSGAGAELHDRLASLAGASPTGVAAKAGKSAPAIATQDDADLGFQPVLLSFEAFALDTVETTYHIQFTPTRQLFANGNDPLNLIRALAELGDLEVQVDLSALPDLDAMDWAESYLVWDLTLRSVEPMSVVQDVFEFVDGCCALTIESQAPTLPSPPAEVPLLVEIANDAAPMVAASKPAPATAEKTAGKSKGTVRVDLELVDRLINIVGELVINQAVLAQRVHNAGLSRLSDVGAGLDEFRSLAREIQENVMAIRAQPIKPLFQRMARIAREASDMAGKSVHLETTGDSTEIDKTVIERLVDPLTHMIRNAVDHGVETADARRAAGKAETGNIRLTAAHRSGRVLIEVTDDGAGINRPKVREIAIRKGLIAAETPMSDAEIDQLLFAPGFSTASQVTGLSGRGVGMDVVRSAIQSLGGRVTVSSTPGQGTTMAISLPLTLAVLDGMVVDVAGQTMVIPITAIVETLRPKAQDIHRIASLGEVVAVREVFVPIIDLAETFGLRPRSGDYRNMVLLVVESGDDNRWALAVDSVRDMRQVVIKGLEANYGHVPGVAAATILGDGKIALIIDPEEAALNARQNLVSTPDPMTEEN